jgi:hypothetical protein
VKVEAAPPGVKVRPVTGGVKKTSVTTSRMNKQNMNQQKSNINHDTQRTSGGRHK